MSLYEFLLIVHLVGVVLMGGAATLTTYTAVRAGQTTDPRAMADHMATIRTSEMFITLPGALITILFGSWLVSEVGYEFSEAWISAAYTLWILIIALDHGVYLRMVRTIHARAEELTAQGVQSSEELRTMANAPLGIAIGVALDVMLLAFLYLMVVRPGS